MKKYLHPKFLPVFIPVAGLLGLMLRLWTLGAGPDKEGLYAPQPVAWTLLWFTTIAVLAAIVLLSARLKNPGRYSDNFPASKLGAAGNALAAVGIMMSGLRLLTSGADLLPSITGILGIVSAVAMVMVAFARYQGKKPSFVLHSIPCLFFALRIFERCKAWSNEPQISNFLFPFMASVCVMLAAYQLACFDVNLGNRRTYLFWGLSGMYFSLVSLIGSDEPVFYAGMAMWLLTNICSVRPLKARKPQQEAAEETPVPAPEAEPEAAAPEIPTAAPQLREDMSYDELLKWLDKE